MNNARFLSGQLLLAMPGIGDPRFEHAVIALCSHDEEGCHPLAVQSCIAIGTGGQKDANY